MVTAVLLAPGPVFGPVVPVDLKRLAARTGCAKPKITLDAEELRQGWCTSATGERYTVVTFVADKGKRDWLDFGKMWGGDDLVGDRWVIGGKLELLQDFQVRIGGAIESARGTSP